MKIFTDSNFFFLAKTAWKYAGADGRKKTLGFYLALLCANVMLSFQPVVLAKIINTAQAGEADAVEKVLGLAILYGSLTLAFWCLHGPSRLIERKVAFATSRKFIEDLYRMITEMPLRWHQDHHSGETINRIRKAERALFQFAQTQFVTIQIVVRTLSSFIMLAFFSVSAAVASAVSILVIACIIRRFDNHLRPTIKATNEAEHFMNSALYDYIGNIITVITLRMQGNTGSEVQSRYEKIKTCFCREIVINEWKWFSTNIFLVLTQIGVMAAYLTTQLNGEGAAQLGGAVAVFQYLLIVMNQVFQSGLTFEQQMYQSTDVHGIDGLLADYEQSKRKSLSRTEKSREWKQIEIQNLFFTHDKEDDELHHLHGISIDIKAGEKIALVGSSGSGKTTLLTLLRGLYEAQTTKLIIDGEEFSSLSPLSEFTTLIPQDSEVFENTILYNLTFGIHIADDILKKAMAISAFDEVLPKMPRGLETDIRERGVNMSGGQKQRLALARGLISARNSSLLLMDEPTSSVDQLTEGRIFDEIFREFSDKTIIATVHRLRLLPIFDRIVLLEDGKIVEQGSFGPLIASNGKLADLWRKAQSHHHR